MYEQIDDQILLNFALLGAKNRRIPDAFDSPVQIDPLITKQILEYIYRYAYQTFKLVAFTKCLF